MKQVQAEAYTKPILPIVDRLAWMEQQWPYKAPEEKEEQQCAPTLN